MRTPKRKILYKFTQGEIEYLIRALSLMDTWADSLAVTIGANARSEMLQKFQKTLKRFPERSIGKDIQ